MTIDLSSDTVTRPTAGMLKAMMQAKVGDDVFKKDPTVNQLEGRLAEMFGMEAALFFPSGTMANQTAIKLHTQPGDQLICDKYSHIYHYEGGGVSFNSGVSCKLVDGHRGMMTVGQVKEAINPPDFYHSPKTALVSIENTTNKGGGACWKISDLIAIKKVCVDNNLAYHLDGARLWNAMVATKTKAGEYSNLFDTISVCLSKGLGCPIGSVLLGNKDHIKQALWIRKKLGGGMRQVGYLAAAGLYALDNHLERMADDHERAKELGGALLKTDYVESVEPIDTNIVIFQLKKGSFDADQFIDLVAKKGMNIINMGGGKLRMVTHLDYTADMHKRALEVLGEIKNMG